MKLAPTFVLNVHLIILANNVSLEHIHSKVVAMLYVLRLRHIFIKINIAEIAYLTIAYCVICLKHNPNVFYVNLAITYLIKNVHLNAQMVINQMQ